MTRHIFRAGVNLDAGNDTRVGYDFNKGSAIFPGLTDGQLFNPPYYQMVRSVWTWTEASLAKSILSILQ